MQLMRGRREVWDCWRKGENERKGQEKEGRKEAVTVNKQNTITTAKILPYYQRLFIANAPPSW